MSHQCGGGAGRAQTPLVRIGEVSKPEHARRDFLAMMGFGLAAGLSGCRAPAQYAIPLPQGSDQIVPGVAEWYATTCGGCPSACGLLVKQRDGRPIKIEGNSLSPLFGGGTCATGQATVLSLYDNERLRGPMWQGRPATWQQIDRQVIDSLDSRKAGRVVLLSGTITSPSMMKIVTEWSRRYPQFRHAVYEPVSLNALRAANAESFGRPVIPHYSLDRARTIVALDADFLGTWLSPVEFARQYAAARKAGSPFPLHVQFESGLSITGTNADLRVPVAPSEIGAVAVALLRRVAQKAGVADVPKAQDPIPDMGKLDAIADQLWKSRGKSLVLSGVEDQRIQIVVNALNFWLGNIGTTVDLVQPSLQRGGDEAAMTELVEQMNRGEISTLMLHGVNPAYDYPDAPRFVAGLKKVALSISFSDRLDETSSQTQAICPDHHFLESWGDAEPVSSHYSLSQPVIAPLFDTRAAQESLLKWSGATLDHYAWLRSFWRENIFPRQSDAPDFDTFWDGSLQSGRVTLSAQAAARPEPFHGDWRAAAHSIIDEASRPREGYEVHLYESVALRDGRHANNPWLQELPDPVTKATWGNFAAVSPALATKLSLSDGDVVSLTVAQLTEQRRVELPVLIQPGQEQRTISVAIGYGRAQAGRVGQGVGANAYPLAAMDGGFRRYSRANVLVAKTGRRVEMAVTQGHFSMEGRPIALETTVEDLEKAEAQRTTNEEESLPTMWPERLHGEHTWGMVVDTDACTGCSACVVACQAENNIPVVGKDEVRRTRIMHWIRIDHYYAGEGDNPTSIHQPMMCQHCGSAPCETVCPVLATTTSSEGINQQVYNRCVGTRYCANNCPYKVRHFNWFNYTDNNPEFPYNMANPVGRLVLNPDVVVRSRGVMEKCNLCVQRIQSAKNLALQEKRELVDGDIQTACQQACPTQAIVFGDLMDAGSRVSKSRHDRRLYSVLEELGTKPHIGYLKKIRNTRYV
jgi:molybdopterin-containing oxidoreductase family iron-sulfur binding subunit